MAPINPLACALFVLAAFVLAGTAQTAWFKSAWSRPFMVPLDGGRTLGGRRIFGANKTVRGFVVMVPACAAAFAILARLLRAAEIDGTGLWTMSYGHYAALGAWAGFGFMAGELPNSFIKRQLGIAEGAAPANIKSAAAQFLADRLDSGIGMLAAMTVMVPVPPRLWAYVLLAGLLIHWSFSILMFRLGIKARAA
jgi:hypothetical protein